MSEKIIYRIKLESKLLDIEEQLRNFEFMLKTEIPERINSLITKAEFYKKRIEELEKAEANNKQ